MNFHSVGETKDRKRDKNQWKENIVGQKIKRRKVNDKNITPPHVLNYENITHRPPSLT